MHKPTTAQAKGSILLAIAATLAAADAVAAQEDGWYMGLAGTVSLLEDVHAVVTGLPDPPVSGGRTEHVHDMDTGFGLQDALGRRFGNFRAEAELGYTNNDSDGYDMLVPFTGHRGADEYHKALRIMANAYVDFGHGAIRPYLGAGAGWTSVNMYQYSQHPIFHELFDDTDYYFFFNDKDSGFAWQLMAGTTWQLTPSVALTAQYRRFDAGRLKIPDVSGFVSRRPHAGSNLDIGIRYRF